MTAADAETALAAVGDDARLLVLSSMDVYRAYGSLLAGVETDPREEPILRRLRAGRQSIPTGPGSFLWTRGYVRDVASGVRLALESEATIGEVLNLGESRTWSMGLWARHVLEAAGGQARFVRVPDPLLPEDLRLLGTKSQHLLVDSSKARDLLGWTETDPHVALDRSVAWHLDHPPEAAGDDFAADDRALAAG